MTVARFAIATLAVLLFILVVVAAQGIGASFGHGLTEPFVR